MSDQVYSLQALRPKIFLPRSISITSETAVGSTTTVKLLVERLGAPSVRVLSGGDIMRAFAKERGMKIEDFAKYNREHPEEGWDKRCDDQIVLESQTGNLIVEGRLVHVFAKQSFHVLLTCPFDVRAERRYKDLKYKGYSLSEVREMVSGRDNNDRERYLKLYPGCDWPEEDFDLVVSTETNSPEVVVEKIISGHQSWSKARDFLGGEDLARM